MSPIRVFLVSDANIRARRSERRFRSEDKPLKKDDKYLVSAFEEIL
jgi:hypothetical protein